MLAILEVDLNSKNEVRRFVNLPFRLYGKHPQWVPPLLMDAELLLNPRKHPFYEHSHAAFFLAVEDGRDVGRVAVLETCPFNLYHHTKQAQFYLLELEDNLQVAQALFERVFEWARERGLNRIVGPKGFSILDGYGLLIDGFEQRQMMSLTNYNPQYYPQLVEALGFQKEVDFHSWRADIASFHMPDRVHRIAERIQQRGKLRVQRFKSKKELTAWADRIGQAYSNAFVNNWEYYPPTEREIKFITDSLLVIANPRLVKLIMHGDDVVGFLFAFPDASAALQRARGHLWPFGLVDLLIEMKRTKWVALNGMGILPEFQGMGGNALLYSEMEKTIRDFGFEHADLTQVAETAVQMSRDMSTMGAPCYKTHRVYVREI